MENTIYLYLLKSSVSLIAFYGLYLVLLRKDTFLKLRRFYFLFAIIFSLIYPFVSFELSPAEEMPITTGWFSGFEGNPVVIIAGEAVASQTVSWQMLLLTILAVVSALLLMKFLFQMSSLVRLKQRNRVEEVDNYTIVEISEDNGSSFSFFKWIFVNTSGENHKDISEIIIHEKVHARQLHSVDVMIAEMFCILFWWNPIAWFIRKEMKINLEYLADKGVLDEGCDTREYQYVLLQVTTLKNGIPLINNFNVSQLKKRITMMNKKKTSILLSAKYLLMLPIAVALLLSNCTSSVAPEDELDIEAAEVAHPNIVEPTDIRVFTVVEDMPGYPGGEAEMHKYIGSNLKYPVAAQENGIQGRVTIRFVVQADGKVTDPVVLRGIDAECDAEAVRVVKAMPNWQPGKQNGHDVPVYFALPVVFRLEGNKNNEAAISKQETKTSADLRALYLVDGRVVSSEEIRIAEKNTNQVLHVTAVNKENEAALIKKYGQVVKGKTYIMEIKKKI